MEKLNKLTPYERLEVVRHKGRPTIRDYIPLIFDEFWEMHGDRLFGDDGAIMGGIASISGTVIGVFIISLLQQGILALGFTKEYQYIITGLIVIGAVYADVSARRRKN